MVSLAIEENKDPVKFILVDKKNGTYDVEFTPVEVKPIIAQVCHMVYDPLFVEDSLIKVYLLIQLIN